MNTVNEFVGLATLAAINLIHISPVLRFIQKLVICSAKQMTGFYMKRNTGLKWVNENQSDLSQN